MKLRLFRRLQALTKQWRSGAVAADAVRTESLAISRHVRASSDGDQLALLAVDSGLVFTCNRTGGRVWQELAARRPPSLIAADISREYGLPEESVHACIDEFVGELRRLGLVSLTGGGGD